MANNPTGKKLALNVPSSFSERHPTQWKLLLKAVTMKGARWSMPVNCMEKRKTRSGAKEAAEVVDIFHLTDLDALAGKVALVDRIASGPQTDALCGVLLTTTTESALQEQAQSSGGA